jgi:hypothetical protein
MLVVMLKKRLAACPISGETLYAVSGILLPKSGFTRECHWTVAQIVG